MYLYVELSLLEDLNNKLQQPVLKIIMTGEIKEILIVST